MPIQKLIHGITSYKFLLLCLYVLPCCAPANKKSEITPLPKDIQANPATGQELQTTTESPHPLVRIEERLVEEGVSDTDNYYASIDETGTGEALRLSLYELIKNQDRLTYSETKDVLSQIDRSEDEHDIVLFYTGEVIDDTQSDLWNREHVWPASRGVKGTPAYTDVHHLHLTLATVNNIRGDKDFGEGGKEISFAKGNYFNKNTFEPKDVFKGNTARTLFYVATRYMKENLPLNLVASDPERSHEMSNLCMMLRWNEQDPVDEMEKLRNQVIFEYWQHNRNPFIDHPEFARQIWGQDCK